MFKVGEDIQAYPEKDVVGIFMSAGVKTREAQATSPARSVPAGTAMVIRMTDSINSSKHKVGHRFRGQLEGAAAVGLLIGRSSGAKTRAAVGLGASILTSGSSLSVPAGTMLDTTLRVPFQLSN
jgi:hypothetical protein